MASNQLGCISKRKVPVCCYFEQHYVCGDNIHEDFAICFGILKDGRKPYGVD